MRKLLCGLLATASLLACRQKAQDETQSARDMHPNCIGDKYTVAGRNQSQGACLDVTVFRAARVLTGATLELAKRDYGIQVDTAREMLVANVRHKKKFWIAKIPTNPGPREGIFQVEEFLMAFGNMQASIDQIPDRAQRAQAQATYAAFMQTLERHPQLKREYEQGLATKEYKMAHGQVRLKFQTPVELYEQTTRATANFERTSLPELILSLHAVAPGPRPGEFDPAKGTTGEYGVAMGIFSLPEKYNFSIKEKPTPNNIRQYRMSPMVATPARLLAVLREWATRAPREMQEQPYNLFSRNCGSQIFEVLENVGVVRPPIDLARDPEGVVLGRQYPKYAQNALAWRDVVNLKSGQRADPQGHVLDSQLEGVLPTLAEECRTNPACHL